MTELAINQSILDTFEAAWRAGKPLQIKDLVSQAEYAKSAATVVELVCVDLEYQWQRRDEDHQTSPRSVDSYMLEFPDVFSHETWLIELITEDYRARHRWGDRPRPELIVKKYPTTATQLSAELRRIDSELQRETDSGRNPIDIRSGSVSLVDRSVHSLNVIDYRDFVLERMIGYGGTGKVYQARQLSVSRLVAIKYLRKALIHDTTAVQRFLGEATAIIRLKHENIVRVHGIGASPRSYFIALELIDGENLKTLIDRRAYGLSQTIHWMIQLCRAIEHAHQHGVVHCDLKPSNVLIDRQGNVRLTDFGFAVVEQETTPDRLEGTAPFMAPEQVSTHWGPIGNHTDMYGLGAVLFTLLGHRPPWTGNRASDILPQVVSSQAVDFELLKSQGLPSALIAIAERSLTKDIASRYQSASQMRATLEAIDVD